MLKIRDCFKFTPRALTSTQATWMAIFQGLVVGLIYFSSRNAYVFLGAILPLLRILNFKYYIRLMGLIELAFLYLTQLINIFLLALTYLLIVVPLGIAFKVCDPMKVRFRKDTQKTYRSPGMELREGYFDHPF